MRRWLTLPAVSVLAALAACGGGTDRAADDDAPSTPSQAERAVEVARLAVPTALTDATVTDLLDGLCDAAGSGDVAGVATRLQSVGIAPDGVPSALDALAAGASTYCPDDVDAVVPQVQQALAPPTPTSAVAPAEAERAASTAGSGGAGTSSATPAPGTAGAVNATGSDGSTATGGTSGSGSNSSSSASSSGGGNASGTGNQSSTGLTQGVGSGGATNTAG